MSTVAPIVVIGVGNLLMGDDGIGPVVAQRLDGTFGPDVEIIDGGVGGLSLLDWIAGRDEVLIVDAARMGREPGEVVRFDVESIADSETHTDVSHATGVVDVLKLGAAMSELPKVTIFGVEPERVEPGIGLSVTCEQAVITVTEMIRAELGRP